MPTTTLFMRLTSEGGQAINGESEVEDFEQAIELDDWNWGIGYQLGDDSGRDEVVPTKFSFSKPPDCSSPVLMSYLYAGKVFPKMVIHFVDWTASRFKLEVELLEVRLTSLEFNGNQSEAAADLDERWECDFNQVKFTSSVRDETGKRVQRNVVLPRPANASLEAPVKLDKPKKDEAKKDDPKGKKGGKASPKSGG
jgi:type VI protein secretion system component Hcp